MNLLAFNMKIIRRNALNIIGSTQLSMYYVLIGTVTPKNRRDVLNSLNITGNAFQIPVTHAPLPSFIKAFIRLACPI